MFIAMNRFQVAKELAAEFERVWLERDSRLVEMDGFLEFQLLRGPEMGDHVLYASHTTWNSRADFDAWTNSDQFRAAHDRAAGARPLFLGHPQFEGFESINTLRAA